jgi:hypothetical protein
MPHPERSQLYDTEQSVRFYTDQLLASQPERVETRASGTLRFDSAVSIAQHGLVTHIHRIQGTHLDQEFYKYSITCPSLEAISRKIGRLMKMYDLLIESNQLPSLNIYAVKKPHRLLTSDTDVSPVVATRASMLRFLAVLQNSELADTATIALEEERAKKADPKELRESVGRLRMVPAYMSKNTIMRAIR